MVSQAVTFFVNYLFSLISVPFCLNRRDLCCNKGLPKKPFTAFFLANYSCLQGRICKKCISKRREQARQAKFAAIKPKRWWQENPGRA